MRTMLMVELGTEASNKHINDGDLSKTMDDVLGALKPEAAYFYAHNGQRAMTLVVDAPDEASLVTMCEPFWLNMDANVEVVSCMNAEELRNGLSRMR
jgi:hypothetical protein